MSCADDLTTEDLTGNVTAEVLERASAGEGSTTNLWGHIDRDKESGKKLTLQLILQIPFVSSVRLRTLVLHLPAPGHPHRPSRVRLYANARHCPDFRDLESVTPIMDIDISQTPDGIRRLPDGRRDVEEWPLKVQKLSNVFSVTLLFTEATTSQRSTVYFVGFKGVPPKHTMDMSKLGQIPTHNAADKPIDGVMEKQMGSNTTTTR
ncbi:uncharacterized protein L203_100744 [Cryptococcus depauperatus CBS 7841]|uniref:PITH domain-containing protein n=1 Tax=Cryptococcus depauperatus CBS 7841 TaxID=1295531 RepID=A0AAJ8JNL5_9TREE